MQRSIHLSGHKEQRKWFLPTFVIISIIIIMYYWFPAQIPAQHEKNSTNDATDFTDKNFHKKISNGCYNPKCGTCMEFTPTWIEFTKLPTLKGRTNFGKVDVIQEKELAKLYEIQTVPAIKIFRDGGEVAQFTGTDRTLSKLELWVEESLKKYT